MNYTNVFYDLNLVDFNNCAKNGNNKYTKLTISFLAKILTELLDMKIQLNII